MPRIPRLRRFSKGHVPSIDRRRRSRPLRFCTCDCSPGSALETKRERFLRRCRTRFERGFELETINLLKAERFLLADSLDTLLKQSARTTVRELSANTYPQPVFDDDAGAILSRRLPLDRLVEAAQSSTL